MKRHELELILRASAGITGRDRFIVVGSQAVSVHSEFTGRATGQCLEVHDLAVSKLVAGRNKDLTFVEALCRHRLVSTATLRERLELTAITAERMALCEGRIARLLRTLDS